MQAHASRNSKHFMQKKFRKWIFLTSLVAVMLVGLQAIASPPTQMNDQPDEHGMRIVGNKTIYISHMGWFSNYPTKTHDYQAIFEVIFSGKDKPQEKYLSDQMADPNKNEYTLEPTENFPLPNLGSGKLKSFKANIYRGQFERPNTAPSLLAGDVNVQIKRVVYFRRFDPQAKLPSNLEYLLFGDRSEQYVAHLLTSPRDFDQILAVKTPLPLKNAELAKAVRIVFPNRQTPNEQALANLALKANDNEQVVQLNGEATNRQMLAVESEYFMETIDFCGQEGCTPL